MSRNHVPCRECGDTHQNPRSSSLCEECGANLHEVHKAEEQAAEVARQGLVHTIEGRLDKELDDCRTDPNEIVNWLQHNVTPRLAKIMAEENEYV